MGGYVEAGRRKGMSEDGNGTMRRLSRLRGWESLSGQSSPMETLGLGFGTVL